MTGKGTVMADLIAQGQQARDCWRHPLTAGERVILGRGNGLWGVPWDDLISRKHVEICWQDGRLEVHRLPASRNSVIFQGVDAGDFRAAPGDYFVIGDTTFLVADDQSDVFPEDRTPIEQRTYSVQDVEAFRYRDADQRIDVLSRIPDLIANAADDHELFSRLINMLLTGIPQAEAIGLVALAPGTGAVDVLHWGSGEAVGARFQPSGRLIVEAIGNSKSVLHIWDQDDTPEAPQYTVCDAHDWAFCTPVRGEPAEPWGIYVVGRLGLSWLPGMPRNDPAELRDALKFTELAGSILGSLRQSRKLQRRQAVLSQFLSPVVVESLRDKDPEVVLAPRYVESSVLFCDLHGFSREVTRGADDLLGLLRRVGLALQVMTESILRHGGVVGDFQGDAAMGFWGWPLDQPDTVRRACLAAQEIRRQFDFGSGSSRHPLFGFRIGIGIATGKVVAGKIGAAEQAKVGVFGPAVNLASRLEGLTKVLQAPIVVDAATAEAGRCLLHPDLGRFRRLARVLPVGMDAPVEVSELLPPAAELTGLADEHLAVYESAVDAFNAGRWTEAYETLHRVPPSDLAKDFLTVLIARHNRVAPQGWNGVVAMDTKG